MIPKSVIKYISNLNNSQLFGLIFITIFLSVFIYLILQKWSQYNISRIRFLKTALISVLDAGIIFMLYLALPLNRNVTDRQLYMFLFIFYLLNVFAICIFFAESFRELMFWEMIMVLESGILDTAEEEKSYSPELSETLEHIAVLAKGPDIYEYIAVVQCYGNSMNKIDRFEVIRWNIHVAFVVLSMLLVLGFTIM